MNLLPSDKELRFPHILRVNASAGSGKTYLLAMRFVQFLLSDIIKNSGLENLLAITFAREATAEMKRRVLGLLKKAAFGDNETITALSSLVTLKEDIKKRASCAVDEIISSYDKWQIKTIDSFLYRLIQAAPYELGLSQREELYESPQPFYEAAFDRMLVNARNERALNDRLVAFINHYLSFQNRESWWPRNTILKEFENLLKIEEGYGIAFYVGGDNKNTYILAEKLMSKAGEIIKIVDEQGIEIHQNARKAIVKLKAGDILHGLESNYLKKDNPAALVTKKGRCTEDFASAWRELKELAEGYVVSRAKEDALPYIKLFDSWKEALSLIKKRSQCLFFGDIARYAKKMHDEFIVPELVFRLGDRLFHYLIDEFQDTSIIQWQVLSPLIENALSQGGTLFCVGDVKQILYRWRGSNRGVFEQGPVDLAKIVEGGVMDFNLLYNWRSEKAILDFVSKVFDPENLKTWAGIEENNGPYALMREDISYFSGAAQQLPANHEHERDGGFVNIKYLEEAAKDDLLDKAKAWLVDLLKNDVLRRFRHKDVFVLVRNREHEKIFTQAIAQEGIPVLSNRQMDIRQDEIVNEIIQMLRFFDNPMDDCALSIILTGRILEFEWKKETNSDPWNFLEDMGVAMDVGTPLYIRLQKEFQGFWDAILRQFIATAAHLAPYELTASIIKRFEIWERFAPHRPAVEHFLELLHKKSLDAELSAVISWIEQRHEKLFVLNRNEEADAVRVMTIHKAKGLQAKVVIIPFAGLTSNMKGVKIINVDEEKNGLEVLNMPKKKLIDISPKLKNLYSSEEAGIWLDELNVFYVAATRARKELHILVPPKIGKNKNRLPDLFATAFNGDICLGSPMSNQNDLAATDGNKADMKLLDIPCRSDNDALNPYNISQCGRTWPSLIKKRPSTLITGTRRNASKLGDAIHRLLSFIDKPLKIDCKPGDLEAYLKDILDKNAAIYPELTQGQSSYIDLSRIAKTLCSSLARPLFWVETNTDIFVEMEIADETGEVSRVDRLVRTDSTILIGEFKTAGIKHDADIEQIKRYTRLFSEISPNRDIKGLLIYLELGEIIEIKTQDI